MQEFNADQIASLLTFVDSERFSTGQSNRELHLHDISAHRGRLPAGIVWPVTTAEVSKVLTWAYDQDVPVTPWGAGTSTEGTPGTVTEATLRLTGIPSHHLAVTITFNQLDEASRAVAVMIGSGLEPAALELLPPELINLKNRKQKLGLKEVPSLFCEFHGISAAALQETADLAGELCQDCGATGFRFSVEANERAELWRARHEAWETIHRAHPGNETLIVDAAVPISRYPEMIVFSQKLVDDHPVDGYVFGHAGDGNLHVVLVGDPDNEKEWSLLEEINARIVTHAVQLGGTCTGEHGIGIGKRKFMQLEHGDSYQLMRRIKNLIDPKGLLNPGKIFL